MLAALAVLLVLPQDRVSAPAEDTVKVTLSGSLDLDLVYRNEELEDARGSFATPTDAAEGAHDFEGILALRLTADLSAGVQGSMLLRNERLPGDTVFGTNPEGPGLIVKELWLSIDGFLDEHVTVTAGAQRYAFDIRGRGQSMFFDPYHAESMLNDVNATMPTSLPESLSPAGLVVRWREDRVDLVAAGLVMIEGGSSKADEQAALVALTCDFGVASRFGAILALTSLGTSRSRTATAGGGLSVRECAGWELFAEGYGQFGDRRDIILSGKKEGLAGTAFAFQLGARTEGKLAWLEASWMWLGRDDDVTNGEEGRFLSYESMSDLLVVEDAVYGLDLDTNLQAVKLLGGVTPEGRVRLSGAVAFLRLTADAPHIPTALNRTRDLGTEVDGRVTVEISKQVVVHADAGLLFGSKLLNDVTPKDEDRAFVGVVGVTVRF